MVSLFAVFSAFCVSGVGIYCSVGFILLLGMGSASSRVENDEGGFCCCIAAFFSV